LTHPGTYYDTLRKTLALDGLGIDEGTLQDRNFALKKP